MYIAPQAEVLNAQVEKGFIGSSTSGGDFEFDQGL